jgi:hypothetical protein
MVSQSEDDLMLMCRNTRREGGRRDAASMGGQTDSMQEQLTGMRWSNIELQEAEGECSDLIAKIWWSVQRWGRWSWMRQPLAANSLSPSGRHAGQLAEASGEASSVTRRLIPTQYSVRAIVYCTRYGTVLLYSSTGLGTHSTVHPPFTQSNCVQTDGREAASSAWRGG